MDKTHQTILDSVASILKDERTSTGEKIKAVKTELSDLLTAQKDSLGTDLKDLREALNGLLKPDDLTAKTDELSDELRVEMKLLAEQIKASLIEFDIDHASAVEGVADSLVYTNKRLDEVEKHQPVDTPVILPREAQDGEQVEKNDVVYHRGGLFQAIRRSSGTPVEDEASYRTILNGINDIDVTLNEQERQFVYTCNLSDGTTKDFTFREGPKQVDPKVQTTLVKGDYCLSGSKLKIWNGKDWDALELEGPQGKAGLRGRKGAPGKHGIGIDDIIVTDNTIHVLLDNGTTKELLLDIAQQVPEDVDQEIKRYAGMYKTSTTYAKGDVVTTGLGLYLALKKTSKDIYDKASWTRMLATKGEGGAGQAQAQVINQNLLIVPDVAALTALQRAKLNQSQLVYVTSKHQIYELAVSPSVLTHTRKDWELLSNVTVVEHESDLPDSLNDVVAQGTLALVRKDDNDHELHRMYIWDTKDVPILPTDLNITNINVVGTGTTRPRVLITIDGGRNKIAAPGTVTLNYTVDGKAEQAVVNFVTGDTESDIATAMATAIRALPDYSAEGVLVTASEGEILLQGHWATNATPQHIVTLDANHYRGALNTQADLDGLLTQNPNAHFVGEFYWVKAGVVWRGTPVAKDFAMTWDDAVGSFVPTDAPLSLVQTQTHLPVPDATDMSGSEAPAVAAADLAELNSPVPAVTRTLAATAFQASLIHAEDIRNLYNIRAAIVAGSPTYPARIWSPGGASQLPRPAPTPTLSEGDFYVVQFTGATFNGKPIARNMAIIWNATSQTWEVSAAPVTYLPDGTTVDPASVTQAVTPATLTLVPNKTTRWSPGEHITTVDGNDAWWDGAAWHTGQTPNSHTVTAAAYKTDLADQAAVDALLLTTGAKGGDFHIIKAAAGVTINGNAVAQDMCLIWDPISQAWVVGDTPVTYTGGGGGGGIGPIYPGKREIVAVRTQTELDAWFASKPVIGDTLVSLGHAQHRLALTFPGITILTGLVPITSKDPHYSPLRKGDRLAATPLPDGTHTEIRYVHNSILMCVGPDKFLYVANYNHVLGGGSVTPAITPTPGWTIYYEFSYGHPNIYLYEVKDTLNAKGVHEARWIRPLNETIFYVGQRVPVIDPTSFPTATINDPRATDPNNLTPTNAVAAAAADLAALNGPPIIAAVPTTKWTAGQYIITRDGNEAYWDGSKWIDPLLVLGALGPDMTALPVATVAGGTGAGSTSFTAISTTVNQTGPATLNMAPGLGWLPVNRHNWIKPLQVDADHSAQKKDSDLQFTVEPGHEEIKVYDKENDNWITVYSKDAIDNSIASKSAFGGTAQEVSGSQSGATILSSLPDLPTEAAAGNLTDVGRYWTWEGSDHYIIPAVGTTDALTNGISDDLGGANLHKGDWLQIANLGSDTAPNLHWVKISADLLTRSRANNLYMGTWAGSNAYETGAIIVYQKSLYRATRAVAANSAAPTKAGGPWQQEPIGPQGLDELTDVDLTTPPNDNEVLVYELASNTFKPGGLPPAPSQWAIGSLQQSVLDEAEFNAALPITERNKWKLANGQSIAGTALSALKGWPNVPDMRGAYIRMAGANTNHPGWDGGSLMDWQEDKTARPDIPFTTNQAGNHKHRHGKREFGPQEDLWVYGYDHNKVGYGWVSNNEHGHNQYLGYTETTGAHSHQINGGGDAETRPKTLALNYFIKCG